MIFLLSILAKLEQITTICILVSFLFAKYAIFGKCSECEDPALSSKIGLSITNTYISTSFRVFETIIETTTITASGDQDLIQVRAMSDFQAIN